MDRDEMYAEAIADECAPKNASRAAALKKLSISIFFAGNGYGTPNC